MKKIGIGAAHIGNILAITQTVGMVDSDLARTIVIVAHLAVAALMPSFGGLGHKLIFGGNQESEE